MLRGRLVLCLYALCLAPACAGTQKTGEPMQANSSPITYAPMLWPLPEPGGFRTPPPEAWGKGAAVFEDAVTQTNKAQYTQAADTFLKAATVLTVGVDDPYVQTLEAGRNAAYHNAYECYVAAGKRDAGRAKLQEIAKKDLVMARSIEAILAAQ